MKFTVKRWKSPGQVFLVFIGHNVALIYDFDMNTQD